MAGWMRTALAIGLAALTAGAAAAVDLPPVPELPPADAAQNFGGFYLRGDVGGGFEPAPALHVEPAPGAAAVLPPPPTPSIGASSLTPSATADLGFGYRLNAWARFDATLEYRGGARLTSSAFPWRDPAPGRGDVSAVVGLLNAYVDLPGLWGITPFIGAGAGLAVNALSGFSTGGGAFANGSETNFAWALMAGLDYEIAPGLALEFSYRRLDLGAVATGAFSCLPGGGAFCGAGALASRHGLVSNDIRVGLLWTVGPAPAPARD